MATYDPNDPTQDEGRAFSPQQGSTLLTNPATAVSAGSDSTVAPSADAEALRQFADGLSEAGRYNPGAGLPIAPQAPAAPIAAPPPAPLLIPRRPAQGLQLGGQPPSVDEMIQRRLNAINAYPTMSFTQRLLGGQAKYDEALQQLPTLTPLYKEQQAALLQQRKDQVEAVKDVTQTLADFHGRSVTQQEILRPVIATQAQYRLQLAGVPAPVAKEMIEKGLQDAGLVDAIMQQNSDPAFTAEEALNNSRQVASAKDATERLNIQTDINVRKRDDVERKIRPILPQLVSQYRTENNLARDAQVNGTDFTAWAATKLPELAKSPIYRAAWEKIASDDKALAGAGIIPGSVRLKAMEQEALGVDPGKYLDKDQIAEIQKDRDFIARGYRIDQWLKIPPDRRADYIKTADAAIEQRKTRTVVTAADAKAQAEHQVRMKEIIEPKEAANLIDANVFERTGELVQPRGLSRQQAYAQSVYIDDKQREEWTALKRTRLLAGELDNAAANVLTAQNALQGATQRGQAVFSRLFNNDAGRAKLDALNNGTTALMARYMGEKGALSEGDNKRAMAMQYSDGMTADVARVVRETRQRVFDIGEQALKQEMLGKPVDRTAVAQQMRQVIDEGRKQMRPAPGDKLDFGTPQRERK